MLKSDWVKKNKKKVIALACCTLIFSVLYWFYENNGNENVITEGNRAVAIERGDLTKDEMIPLILEVEKNDKKEVYQVTLSLRRLTETGKEKDAGNHQTAEETYSLKAAVDDLIARIEREEDTLIPLPIEMDDGSQLLWKPANRFGAVFIPFLFPLCLFFLYRRDGEKEREDRRRQQEDIRKNLPAFNDQLLLLLNCGLIFHDAFYKIAENHERRNKFDGFGLLLRRIKKEAEDSGQMIGTIMKNISHDLAMGEYSRVVNIIVDHQHRGIDLKDKLEGESHLLWENRKSLAMQKGKEVETKLSFPLALLLVALMLIAGVPAMMNM